MTRHPDEGESSTAAVDITLVQVNGIDVSLSHLVRQMGVADNLGFFGEFARRELVRQLAIRERVCTTLEDLHREVDVWRYKNRLERVEDTEAWLVRRGITLQDVAADAELRLLERMLSDKVAGGRIEPYFAQHTLDFDEAEVCWIFHRDEGVIEEIGLQTRSDGADFCAMAREFSQDERTRSAGGFMGRIRRQQMPKGISARIFAASPSEIFGPEKAAGGFALYMLQQNYPATLDDRVTSEIRQLLFNQWLQKELQRANIHYPIWEAGKEHRQSTPD